MLALVIVQVCSAQPTLQVEVETFNVNNESNRNKEDVSLLNII